MRQIWPRSFGKAIGVSMLVVCIVQIGQAEVMSSSNFKMQSDSINAGGALSNSATYKLEDSVGEQATGNGTSTTYKLKAGYQQMQEVYLSLTAVPNVTLSPSIPGLTGGISTGSAAFIVTTDSPAGYTVTLSATSSPAMRSGVYTIADYVPIGAAPDFLFTTDPTDVHFAYSPEGVDIAQRFRDNGSVCGVGVSDTTNRCFDGLSTSPVEIVRRTTGNHPNGATTTLRFSVGVGGSVAVPAGQYKATSTVTALSL